MSELSREAFEAWLHAYGTAWEARNARAFAALFSRDARYHWTPFEVPKQGHEGISAAFSEATASQRDIAFSCEVLWLAGTRGYAHWTCGFERGATGGEVRLDGILMASFDPDGLCQEFREWWHAEEG